MFFITPHSQSALPTGHPVGAGNPTYEICPPMTGALSSNADCIDLSEVTQGQLRGCPCQRSNLRRSSSEQVLPNQLGLHQTFPGVERLLQCRIIQIRIHRYFCLKINQATSTRSPTASSRVAIMPITPAIGGATRPEISTDVLIARLYQARCEKRSFTGTFSRM